MRNVWYILQQHIAQSQTCVAMFYSEQWVMWRRGLLPPLTCSLCCYVICICYTSCAPVQQIQSTYVTSSSGGPSLRRNQPVMWSWAADMGVCSDVNAVTLSLSFHSNSGSLLRTAKLRGLGAHWHSCSLKITRLFIISRLQLAMFFSSHFPGKFLLSAKINFGCHSSPALPPIHLFLSLYF